MKVCTFANYSLRCETCKRTARSANVRSTYQPFVLYYTLPQTVDPNFYETEVKSLSRIASINKTILSLFTFSVLDKVEKSGELEFKHCFFINFTSANYSYIFYKSFLNSANSLWGKHVNQSWLPHKERLVICCFNFRLYMLKRRHYVYSCTTF